MNKLCAVALISGIAASAVSDVFLPKIMGSEMVLQRDVAAPVWGWADQDEEVTVQFAGQIKKAMPDATGKWMVKLDPMTASAESRVMTIRGKNEIRLSDVLVGEVWLASGQSNMEWTLSGIAKEEQDFAAEQRDNRLVRFFHVERHLQAGVPMDDTMGRWRTCDDMFADPRRSVSAVGFFFALKLQQELDVPVAMLDANWGGQRIECFIPDEGYKTFGLNYRKQGFNSAPNVISANLKTVAASVENSIKASEKGIKVPYIEERIFGWADNSIYNAMIAPLTPYAIKGAIWYQGESNRGATDYYKKLQALSAGWSQVFNVKDIPLYQVQIAPFDYSRGRNLEETTLCDTIWTAQYKGAEEIPGMGIVAIHDTHIDISNIHPVWKRPVGDRLAAQALNKQYGKKGAATGPVFANAERKGSKVIVSFKGVDQGLTTFDGQALSWFELSSDGTTFEAAEAVIKDNTVEVQSAEIQEPAFVRMGWRDTAIPNLADKNGWPVFAFPAQPTR